MNQVFFSFDSSNCPLVGPPCLVSKSLIFTMFLINLGLSNDAVWLEITLECKRQRSDDSNSD